MKVQVLLLAVSVIGLLAARPAGAQTIVSLERGYAHDCFAFAKSGTDAYDGVETCTQAIQREALSRKDLAATYDNRGVLLDRLGKTEKAEADFQMSMSVNSELGDPYVNLGSMLIKQRQYDSAIEQINKGIALGVSFPHVGYYDRAIAEELSGHAKEAYYDFKKVLELEPNYAPAIERMKDFVVTRTPAPAGKTG
jgi:tetratricopeptide (TPR) repeat protein